MKTLSASPAYFLLSVQSSWFARSGAMLVLCILCSLNFHVFAQPSIQWERSLGGSAQENANSVKQTSDGGYILAGYTNSNDSDVTGNHGLDDAWIVKLDPNGSLQWQTCLGGSNQDRAECIAQTSDGGYIMAGNTISSDGDVFGGHGNYDYWVVKLNSIGNIVWQKCLGGSEFEQAQWIAQTTDGGFIVTGYSRSSDGDVSTNQGAEDYWTVKLSNTGNIQWTSSLGGTLSDHAFSVQQTMDGGYLLGGHTTSNDGDVTGNHGNNDYWLVKLNAVGSKVWTKTLGGSSSELTFTARETMDGGYAIGGWSYSSDGDVSLNKGQYDYWMVKLDASRNIEWQKSLGGSNNEFAYSMEQTSDEGFILAGLTGSFDGDVTGYHGIDDDWIVRLDREGNLQWQLCLGGSKQEKAMSIRQSSDAGYILAGQSYSKDGDITGHHAGYDVWVVKLGQAPTQANDMPYKNVITVFPNPGGNKIYLSIPATIQLSDITGRILVSKRHSNSLDLSMYPAAMYLYKLFNTSGELMQQGKLIKE